MQIKSKALKHFFMMLAGKINRPLYEKLRFRIMRGWWPNIYAPTTINEWLLRRKISKKYEKAELSGAIESYRYIKSKGGVKVPNVLAVILDTNSRAHFDNLADGSYILKGSHGSGMIKSFEILEHVPDIPYEELNQLIDDWLIKDYADICGEYCYKSAVPAVLIEKSLTGGNGLALDIKVHCASGVPRILQFLDRRAGNLKRFTWKIGTDASITKIDMFKGELDSEPDISHSLLDEAVTLAGSLSDGMEYVRVDFMISDNDLYFGEFTFFPAGACMPLKNRSADIEFLSLCGL